MQKKTLGGDRLGAGKKMKVELHGYERSTHDKGYLWRSTMSAGTLVPFMVEVALPGDTFDINLNAYSNTHPTIGPLFGSYKMQLDVFQAPMRLYNALLHNNALGIGMKMSKVKFPVISLIAEENQLLEPDDIDNSQINPSCILAYLGIRGVGQTSQVGGTGRTFNAVPFLSVWDIYKNYYANKQEGIGAVIHTSGQALVETITSITVVVDGMDLLVPTQPGVDYHPIQSGTVMIINFTGAKPDMSQIYVTLAQRGTVSLDTIAYETSYVANQYIGAVVFIPNDGLIAWRYQNRYDIKQGPPEVATFDLDNIDDMRNAILSSQSTLFPFSATLWANSGGGKPPYNWVTGISGGRNNMLSSQEGLPIKTYQSDLFNNWLNTEWIDGVDGITELTKIDVSDGLKLDVLNLAKKVYDMFNRIAVSGGTYDDWLDVTYDNNRYIRATTPMYMGGLSKELVFQEVVSNSGGGDQPLGTLAGKGVLSQKHKGGHVVIKVDEPSYIIGLVSLTPRIDYSQGNDWHVHLKTMDDLHKPALDEIGFQDLITEQMAWWDTKYDTAEAKWVQKSAGKQPAWLNYMTSVNKTFGNFAIADNEMFMTLNRRYEHDPATGHIKDLTTYIDPVKYNHIFAETALDAQNFWVQISVDNTVRRKMSAKVMPNV